MKISKLHIIYISIIVFLILIWFNQVSSLNRQHTIDTTNITLLNQKIDTFRNRIGELVYQQEVLETTSKETIKSLTDSLHLKLNNPSFVIHTSTSTKIDSIFIPFNDTILDSIPNYIICDSCISVPKSFTLNNKWFNITGSVVKKGINIHNILIPDEEYLVISDKKYGFLNLKHKKVVTILHKNPNIVVNKQQSLEYKETKNKWISPVIAGLLTGLITYTILH